MRIRSKPADLYSYVFKFAGVFEIIEIVCEVDSGHYSPASASVGVSGKDTALFFQQVSTRFPLRN